MNLHPFESPTFEMACRQFDLVADVLEIPEAMRERDLAPRMRKSLAEFVHLGSWDNLSAP